MKIFFAVKLNGILENFPQPDSACFPPPLGSLGFFSFSSLEILCYWITIQPVNPKSAVGVSRAQKEMCW